jgi:haloalkane dehalogenase
MVPSSPDHPSVPPLREIEAWIREFDGPMELVWGERDPILGRALKRHEEAFLRATVTRTQAGHFLQEEVPKELARAIADVAPGDH